MSARQAFFVNLPSRHTSLRESILHQSSLRALLVLLHPGVVISLGEGEDVAQRVGLPQLRRLSAAGSSGQWAVDSGSLQEGDFAIDIE